MVLVTPSLRPVYSNGVMGLCRTDSFVIPTCRLDSNNSVVPWSERTVVGMTVRLVFGVRYALLSSEELTENNLPARYMNAGSVKRRLFFNR
jgi:hypothetical protein